MGKRKLCTSMLVGAVIGGLIALRHPEVRRYTKRKLSDAKAKTGDLIKNPSEAVYHTRVAFDQFSHQFTSGAESAINALEQIEETLEKVSKKTTKNTKIHLIE